MTDTYREMLKQPRPEDVGRNFGKDTTFLLVLLTRRIVVFLARPLAATDTRVTRVTCNRNEEGKVITRRLGNHGKVIRQFPRIARSIAAIDGHCERGIMFTSYSKNIINEKSKFASIIVYSLKSLFHIVKIVSNVTEETSTVESLTISRNVGKY